MLLAHDTMAEKPDSKPPYSIRSVPAGNGARRRGMNWFRFWIQMLVALLVFNVLAAVVTWFFIFPHLHPAP